MPVLMNCRCGSCHSSGPGKRASSAAAPGRWLGVSTNPRPVPAGSLGAAALFEKPAELDRVDLSCSVLLGRVAEARVLASWSSPG